MECEKVRISAKHRVINKDVKSGSTAAMSLIVRVGGLFWSKIGATCYYAQLGLPDKGRAIKGMVF